MIRWVDLCGPEEPRRRIAIAASLSLEGLVMVWEWGSSGETYLTRNSQHAPHTCPSTVLVLVILDTLEHTLGKGGILDRAKPHRSSELQRSASKKSFIAR